MKDGKTSIPSLNDILRRISDDKTLALFDSIALSAGRHTNLNKRTQLTAKQYYSRLSGLTQVGLTKKYQGKYLLTSLGKIVYHIYAELGIVLNYYWKVRAIESIELSSPTGLSREDLSKLINSLIDNHEIRDIMTNALLSSYDGDENINSFIDRKEKKRPGK
jgi:hypothetical protein